MHRSEARAGYLMLLPFAVIFVVTVIAPLVYAAYLSLYRHRIIGGTVFVGFANFTRALTDPMFLSGIGRVALFFVVQVPTMLALSLALALVIDAGVVYLKRFVRLAVFVPYAVPAVVAALMWGYLYGADYGPFAQWARALSLPVPQFLSESTILFSIMNIGAWSYVGYNMMIMYAALRTVPTELYEAARIDGANELRIARHIKIPALRPALILTGVFSVIGAFQLFNEPQIMSLLAPAVIGSGFTPNLYAYHLAFQSKDVNYAAAVAFLLGFVIIVVSYVFQLSTRRKDVES